MASNAFNIQLTAARLLREVIDQGRSLDKVLAKEFERLKPEQQPQLQEIAYGGCRHYFYLDGILANLLSKPIRNKDRMVHFVLLVGLYQVEFMRIPDHAAVNQCVKALAASKQTWAKGLVNGVLREYLRKRQNPEAKTLEAPLSPSAKASLPEWLYQQIHQSWPDHAEAVIETSRVKPPMILRANQQQTTRDEYLALLDKNELSATATTDSPIGIVLDQPVAVNKLPLFEQGAVSVQDEAAQLCCLELDLAPNQRVLDGCAAPGGKSCGILECEPTIELTAVDLPERVATIHQNLKRIGLNAEVINAPLQDHIEWWDGKPFDRILLDVPCSGTGVIRRHPDIPHRRNPDDLERFAHQQLELLETAWELLQQDGILLYVTCSIMPTENDFVIKQFLAKTKDLEVEPITRFNGTKTEYGYQRLPGVHPGDGFYYCKLVKL